MLWLVEMGHTAVMRRMHAVGKPKAVLFERTLVLCVGNLLYPLRRMENKIKGGTMMAANSGRGLALLFVSLLFGTMTNLRVLEADQIPTVSVLPSPETETLFEGQGGMVTVTVTNVSGRAILIDSMGIFNETVAGDEDDQVKRIRPGADGCSDKTLAKGQSCQFPYNFSTDAVSPGEDQGAGISRLEVKAFFTVPPGHDFEDAANATYVTVKDPGCPLIAGPASGSCAPTPEPSTLCLMGTALGALAVSRKRRA